MTTILDFIKDLKSHRKYIIQDVTPENKNSFVYDYDNDKEWFIDFTICNEEEMGDGEAYFSIHSDTLKTIESNVSDDGITYTIETDDELLTIVFPKKFKKIKK